MKRLLPTFLFIFALTLFLSPTVHANGISWTDFVAQVNDNLSIQGAQNFDFESVLNSAGVFSSFKDDFNSCVSFTVLGNFGANDSVNNIEPTKLYFIFPRSSTDFHVEARFNSNTYTFYFPKGTAYYVFDYATDTVSSRNYTSTSSSSSKVAIESYSLSRFPQFSNSNWQTDETFTYLCDKTYVQPLSWNCGFWISSGFGHSFSVSMDSMNESEYPWENEGAGGGEDVYYYNYDYSEEFRRPYITIDNYNGLVNNWSDGNIPFAIYSQSGDEYYPFDMLKLDLVVYDVTSTSGDVTGMVIDSYSLQHSGDYATTDGYASTSVDGNMIKHMYNLYSKFDSSWIAQYFNQTLPTQYGFRIILKSFWGDTIAQTRVVYFNTMNALNSVPYDDLASDSSIRTAIDNYYAQGYGLDLSPTNTNFSNLVDTFTTFMSVIFGFFVVFPAWLTSLLTLGIMAAIALRVLGR